MTGTMAATARRILITRADVELPEPGTVIRLDEADYLDGTGPITLQILEVWRGAYRIPGIEWLHVWAVRTDVTDSTPGRYVVRTSALASPRRDRHTGTTATPRQPPSTGTPAPTADHHTPVRRGRPAEPGGRPTDAPAPCAPIRHTSLDNPPGPVTP
mgnify:CR=1 FL=1